MTSSRLDALLVHNSVPNWRITAWLVMLLVVFLLIWANFLTIKEVTVASGKFVSPVGIKKINHSEGGIIEGIHVSDNQVVNIDAPLMLIKAFGPGDDREELKTRLDKLYLIKIRLDAEIQDENDLLYPEELVNRLPEEVSLQQQQFDARRLQIETSTSLFEQKVNMARSELRELEAQLRAVKNNLRMGKKRFEMSKSLLNEGLTIEREHLQLEAELVRLKVQAQTLETSLPQAKKTLAVAEVQIKELTDQLKSDAQEEMSKTEKAIERIEQLLASSNDQAMRTMIRSPIGGTVKLLHDTVGKVIPPNESIMEIIPTESSLVVEVKLKPSDRPFVVSNQSAIIKLSAYDYIRFGSLKGRVKMVAPVASIDENGEPFFKVSVETYKSFLGDDPMLFKVLPGMLATVDIYTGEKSLMDYLVVPVAQLNHRAFRER